MSWWHPQMVWIRHLPTGHRVAVEVRRSFFRAREMAMHMLKSKLYADKIGHGRREHLVRCYELESLPEEDRGLAQMREFDAKYKPGRK